VERGLQRRFHNLEPPSKYARERGLSCLH
jgi:hypothetical protein